MTTFNINQVKHFDIYKTFDCGQTFRYDKQTDCIFGIFRDMCITLSQKDNCVTIKTSKDISEEYFKTEIVPYLALDEDYDIVNKDVISHFSQNKEIIEKAVIISDGIRILKQDFFETLISFVISQNNNIPRIKKIISRLCEKFGDEIEYNGKLYYTFPSPIKLNDATLNELKECGVGFRDRYIKSAVQKYLDGTLDYDRLKNMSYTKQLKTLTSVCGIGKKVANCVILFSLHNLSAFPVDVWIQRVIDKYYGTSLDLDNLGPYAGVAQQYLFYFERYNKGE